MVYRHETTRVRTMYHLTCHTCTCTGHSDDANVQALQAELSRQCESLTLLGSFHMTDTTHPSA